MEKLNYSQKGITLIALVITIIVLLILAGISIAMLTGENGILTQAQKAKEETEKASVIEQAKTDILEIQIEGNIILTKTQLKDVLSKYFEPMPEEVSIDDILTTKEDYGGKYEIAVSEIYDGELAKTAGEVLKVNPDGSTPEEKSPYVKYNGLDCRVLYSDEIHGIQIVAENNVEDVTLGETGNFEKSREDYNNAIDILNNKAKEYKGTKAIDARCLGGIAELKDGKFQGDTGGTYYVEGYEFKTTANYTHADLGQMQKLELNTTSDSWLASRSLSSIGGNNISGKGFCVRYLGSNYKDWDDTVCAVYSEVYSESDSKQRGYSCTHGLRPVFLISPDTAITSGDGSEEDPYIIE